MPSERARDRHEERMRTLGADAPAGAACVDHLRFGR
jgi:hypothetical protein